jgi:hypothetical protein
MAKPILKNHMQAPVTENSRELIMPQANECREAIGGSALYVEGNFKWHQEM